MKGRQGIIAKRLRSKINSQELLIAELYYAWDLRSVRSRIRRYMENSDIARDMRQRKQQRRTPK